MARTHTLALFPRAARRGAVSLRPRRALAGAALSLTLVAATLGAPAAGAAGINPLPAVATALSHVTSYEVTITMTSSFSGTRPPRPTGTPQPTRTPRAGRGSGRGGFFGFGRGAQTRTIVAVRKGNLFEDYITVTGKTATGATQTTSLIVYGTKECTRASGSSAYTCRTMTNGGFNLDPTAAFAAGAGSTTFTTTGSKTIGGQLCLGYPYKNISQYASATGVVYIARQTNLPCEQDAVNTRRFSTGTGTLEQRTTDIWSHFNDRALTVPAVPA